MTWMFQAHRVTYEAFDAMKGCDFTSAVIKKVADAHSVGVSQVCLRSRSRRLSSI